MKKANLYVKLTAKSPFLFISLVLISLASIVYLSLTTKLDIIKTYKAHWDGQSLIIPEVLSFYGGNAFVYENRNEEVYALTISPADIKTSKDNTQIAVSDTEMDFQSDTIMLDIPIGEETLFTRVFAHGGTNE